MNTPNENNSSLDFFLSLPLILLLLLVFRFVKITYRSHYHSKRPAMPLINLPYWIKFQVRLWYSLVRPILRNVPCPHMVNKWKNERKINTLRHTQTERGYVFISAYRFQSNGICSHRCKQMENKCSIFLCQTADRLNHGKSKNSITENTMTFYRVCVEMCVCVYVCAGKVLQLMLVIY